MKYTFTSKMWEYGGSNSWYFISLPGGISAELKALFSDNTKAFGSIKVRAIIGKTAWDTSIFPNKKQATYDLPIKKLVRTAEGLQTGADVRVSLGIVDLL